MLDEHFVIYLYLSELYSCHIVPYIYYIYTLQNLWGFIFDAWLPCQVESALQNNIFNIIISELTMFTLADFWLYY